jgi:metal-dependent amidase/aminoacylase/carboxypeptidase family protein
MHGAQSWQTTVSAARPLDAGVLSSRKSHAGSATVIPDDATVGTVRTFTLPVLDLMEQRMRDVASHGRCLRRRSGIQLQAQLPADQPRAGVPRLPSG